MSLPADWAAPPGLGPARARRVRVGESTVAHGEWDRESAAATLDRLASAGRDALAGLRGEDLYAAWTAACSSWLGVSRPRLAGLLAAGTRLSRAGLEAALELVFAGAAGPAARGLLLAGEDRSPPVPRSALVVLAGNVPGLALQPLLAALAVRCPLLIKSAADEPYFAPSFVRALVVAEPRLADAIAACRWPGGDLSIEDLVRERTGRIVVYGGDGAIESWALRSFPPASTGAHGERPGDPRVVAMGPATSIAIVAADGADWCSPALAAALARDVALLDQRGCLSLGTVLVIGSGEAAGLLGAALAAALADAAAELPPGRALPEELGRAQRLRLAALAAGLGVHALEPIARGTVLVDPAAAIDQTVGLRSVCVIPVASAADALARVAAGPARVQGAALVGREARSLRGAFGRLGVSRVVGAGELQRVDASWANGGVEPLALFAATGDGGTGDAGD